MGHIQGLKGQHELVLGNGKLSLALQKDSFVRLIRSQFIFLFMFDLKENRF